MSDSKKNDVPVLGTLLAVVFIAFAVWLIAEIGLIPAAIVAAAALVFCGVVRWCWLPSRKLPGHRVRHLRWRLRCRLHPGRGHATIAELWVCWGRFAAFRHSGRTRASMGRWERARAGAYAWSLFIGRAHHRHGLRVPLQEHIVVYGPPRQGKTGWLARQILRYPGPVLSTTTKADIYGFTAAVRRNAGPVAVFNPQDIGNVPSTFAWDPISGCERPSVAIRRADAFFHGVSVQGVEDASFWRSSAAGYLRVYFHAAAVAGGDLRLVRKWVLGAGPGEAERILLDAGADQWWALELAQLQGTAAKTIETIRITMTRALEFMADPALARAVLPAPGQGLDFGRFLAASGSLYMIAEAEGEDSPLAPLFAALAAEVHKTATRIGGRMPGGRLDPPLLMALDEVTQICPVPLPNWMSDSGGKGVQVIAVCHGMAQLKGRWQAHGARVVMDTAGVKAFLRGIDDPETLEMASKLAGTAEHTKGDSTGRHDILSPDMLRQLPTWHALIIRSGLAPVIARLPMIWRDPLYQQAQRAAKRAPVLRPAVERPALEPAHVRALPAAAVAVEAPRETVEGIVVSPPVRVTEPPSEREPVFPWSTR